MRDQPLDRDRSLEQRQLELPAEGRQKAFNTKSPSESPAFGDGGRPKSSREVFQVKKAVTCPQPGDGSSQNSQ